jgi:6-hydroxy-3-succinoylpyridine 3-monooxygenase
MTLRTRVYVDGYNLYYGCLRKTSYKWLDIRAPAERILATVLQDVNGEPAVFRLAPLALKCSTVATLKNLARSDDSARARRPTIRRFAAILG